MPGARGARGCTIPRAMARTLFLGAEVRVDPESQGSPWDDARRTTYLLHRNVARPLSVDRAVWASFPTANGECPSDPLPWVSVEAVLERAAEARATGQLRVVTLVIGLVVAGSSDESLAASQGIGVEVVVEPGWQPLGFDIADATMVSGLSNCAYTADEAAALRDPWSARLNEHGLFAFLPDALAFRTVTDERVREHAPFAVYAMWLVPGSAVSGP